MKITLTKTSGVPHQDAIALLTEDHKAVKKILKNSKNSSNMTEAIKRNPNW